jgi:hypothetical protein
VVGLAGEVELGVGADDDVGEAEGDEAAEDCGADEAPVAGDEDLRVLVGEEGRQRICGGRQREGGEQSRKLRCGGSVTGTSWITGGGDGAHVAGGGAMDGDGRTRFAGPVRGIWDFV